MRRSVGILLLVTAALKAAELYLQPFSIREDNFGRILLPLLIGCELALGLAALCNLFWQQLRPMAIVLFLAFASYSLALALHGTASCGCFGQLIEVNPWWTFVFDIVIVAGLVLDCLTNRRTENAVEELTAWSRRPCLVGIMMASIAVALGLAWHVMPQQASSQDGLMSVGGIVVLSPEDWVGRDFPLSDYVDIDVSQGQWVVLLHRHDCPKCQEALPRYEKMAVSRPDFDVAIVEVPPHHRMLASHSDRCRVGRLTADREWFVETPVEIQLQDGVVVAASTKLPTINSDWAQETATSNAIRLGCSWLTDVTASSAWSERF